MTDPNAPGRGASLSPGQDDQAPVSPIRPSGAQDRQSDFARIANPGRDPMDPRDPSKEPVFRPEAGTQSQTERENAVPEGWPLEADRVALHSPLVETLRLIAAHYGRRSSYESLTAGLPIARRGITPSLFIRAAERVQLHARLSERTLESLAIAPNLPCILVLEKGQACILWEVLSPEASPAKKDLGRPLDIHPQTLFRVQFPETEGERQDLSLEALQKLYAGYAFFIRPVARSDERAGPAEIDNARDWFWASLWESRSVYGEVVLAAFVINLFALVSSLYIMNVYDRVVPNSAYGTLWVLSVGVGILYIFDFVIKIFARISWTMQGRRPTSKSRRCCSNRFWA